MLFIGNARDLEPNRGLMHVSHNSCQMCQLSLICLYLAQMRAKPQCSTISVKVLWIILGCVISVILQQARAPYELVMFHKTYVINGFTGATSFCFL